MKPPPVAGSMTVFLVWLPLESTAFAQDDRAAAPPASASSSSRVRSSAPTVAPRPAPDEPPSPRAAPGRDNADTSFLQWRLGGRVVASTHPTWSAPNLGGMGVISLELPWAFKKMMFEIGAGATSGHVSSAQAEGWTVPPTYTYFILDTQACLLDLPIGNTGLSVLGCLHVAGALFGSSGVYSGGGPPEVTGDGAAALWTGVSARLRWQTPVRLYLEANGDAMYGTVSQGEDNDRPLGQPELQPGWFGVGVGAGILLYPFDKTPP
jgi:hypothetical protein